MGYRLEETSQSCRDEAIGCGLECAEQVSGVLWELLCYPLQGAVSVLVGVGSEGQT